ncbi:unnamed protein product [Oppiella nova]|uniref:Uncharacterized protein n=1 Tax=Oppiella nova TaxID=334625 RepID=A0A7R9QQW1_9ACAR|nr:unnamed protein product [Oppiella nova]CAG2170505.1 unnamed protein product [Oppiella nova]
MVASNHNIPQLLSTNSVTNPNIRSGAPINPMIPNGSPSGQLFPRLPGNIGRPMLPTPTFRPRVPAPNLLGAAQMEMLLRMQSSFADLRHPLPPFPPHPPAAHSFPGLPHMNGMLRSNGTPLIQPSLQTNGSLPAPHIYPNLPLLPPITIMVPYPVPLPIPIPIPVPILFPIDKNSKSENVNQNHNKNSNNQTNISSSNDVTTTSHNLNGGTLTSSTTTTTSPVCTASKVESVISKLVERKTKANNNSNHLNVNNSHKNGNSRVGETDDKKSCHENEDHLSDNESGEVLPQNLVVPHNRRPLTDTYSPPVLNSGYHL